MNLWVMTAYLLKVEIVYSKCNSVESQLKLSIYVLDFSKLIFTLSLIIKTAQCSMWRVRLNQSRKSLRFKSKSASKCSHKRHNLSLNLTIDLTIVTIFWRLRLIDHEWRKRTLEINWSTLLRFTMSDVARDKQMRISSHSMK